MDSSPKHPCPCSPLSPFGPSHTLLADGLSFLELGGAPPAGQGPHLGSTSAVPQGLLSRQRVERVLAPGRSQAGAEQLGRPLPVSLSRMTALPGPHQGPGNM